jgi:hypothetical protein
MAMCCQKTATWKCDASYEIGYAKERRPHGYGKKLVAIVRLKNLNWSWQQFSRTESHLQNINGPEYQWPRLMEIYEVEPNHIYRRVVEGQKEGHPGRPGKGRKSQRR